MNLWTLDKAKTVGLSRKDSLERTRQEILRVIACKCHHRG